MTIKDICDILRAELYNNGFEYGFIVNDQKYKPNMDNGFDNEYYHLAKTIYIVQAPSVTLSKQKRIETSLSACLKRDWRYTPT